MYKNHDQLFTAMLCVEVLQVQYIDLLINKFMFCESRRHCDY